MNLQNMKKISINGVSMKSLSINGIEIWREAPSYTNQVLSSTDTSGNLYNGIGYKDGYRVRSGGAEETATGASCTGFIKVQDGDIIRLSGWDFAINSNGNAINVVDANYNNIGQFTMLGASYGVLLENGYDRDDVIPESSGVWRVELPANLGIEYIRVTGQVNNNTGAAMIVTINEEITK